MAYAEVDDVRQQAPQIDLSGHSKPSEADVAEYIAEIESSLNAALSNLAFVLPVSEIDSPRSYSILRDMVVHATIARILRARLYGIAPVTGSGADEAQQYYDDRLKWLQDPKHPFDLPDAVQSPNTTKQAGGWRRRFGTMTTDTDVLEERPLVTMQQRH